MEFDVRTILIIFGFVVIGLIFLDGIRRMRRAHHDSIRMRMDIGSQYEDVDMFGGELPGGGARPVKPHDDFDDEDYNDPIFAPRNADLSKYAREDEEAENYDHLTASREDELDFAEQAELFSQDHNEVREQEQVEPDVSPARPAARKVAEPAQKANIPAADSQPAYAQKVSAQKANTHRENVQREQEAEVVLENHESANATLNRPQQPVARKVVQQRETSIQKQPIRKQPAHGQPRKVAQYSESKQQAKIQAREIEELVVFNLMAKPGRVIKGDQLLEAVLACNMRYGKRNIFHRYELANGDGEEVFSLANIMEPGTFDIHNMDKLQTKGICLFLTLPGPLDPIQAFDLMVDSLKILVEKLLCDVKDEHHSVLTQQTLEHHRQRIVEYQRRLLSRSTIH